MGGGTGGAIRGAGATGVAGGTSRCICAGGSAGGVAQAAAKTSTPVKHDRRAFLLANMRKHPYGVAFCL
jgi:hypothetical protein